MKALFPFHYIPVKPLVQGHSEHRKQNSASFSNLIFSVLSSKNSPQCELFLNFYFTNEENDNILL